MPRPEKVAAVAEIKERIERARAVFLAEYAGLSVKQQQELRRGLLEHGAEFKVVKMTLARRAASDLELTDLDELLIGPTGLAFADSDAVSAAKVLKEFASSHEVFAIKGGLLGTDFLTPERISELAEIAPRDELLAKIAGAMKAPISAMASLLAALPRGAATVFQQLLEKKQASEPVAAAPVEKPAAEAAVADDGQPAADADPESEAVVEAPESEPAAEVAVDEVDAAEDAAVDEVDEVDAVEAVEAVDEVDAVEAVEAVDEVDAVEAVDAAEEAVEQAAVEESAEVADSEDVEKVAAQADAATDTADETTDEDMPAAPAEEEE